MDLTPYIGLILIISFLPLLIFLICIVGINWKLGDIRDSLDKICKNSGK